MTYVIKPGGTGYYAGRDVTGSVYNRARKYAIPYQSKEVAQTRCNELNRLAGYKYYKVVKVADTVKFTNYKSYVM